VDGGGGGALGVATDRVERRNGLRKDSEASIEEPNFSGDMVQEVLGVSA
jgi:hypothetical protein